MKKFLIRLTSIPYLMLHVPAFLIHFGVWVVTGEVKQSERFFDFLMSFRIVKKICDVVWDWGEHYQKIGNKRR